MENLDIAIRDLQEKLSWYQSANMNSFKAFTEHEKSIECALNILIALNNLNKL